MTARVLMIQGTGSDVGKSLLAAGLCRVFARRGHRVRPFKSQNMSRNAFVTPDGFEIGTAQAVQAEACGVPPSVHMNPILLKPEPGMRSQVVVRGRSEGARTYGEYGADFRRYREIAWESLEALRAESGLVIIEGAGSPAEINLRRTDIANMDVALRANAPVILVGDISRGGVYASFAGTLSLLADEERALVRGLLINKLMGDPTLLDRGNDAIAARTGVPVVGVMPMIPDLAVAEEDSMALHARRGVRRAGLSEVEIAIVRYPAMSNYDEFRALETEPGVVVRYVESARDVFGADLVILPGSKATRSDLAWVRAKGFDHTITERARAGGPTLGICGGCQILGRVVRDPEGAEGEPGSAIGLGLLPIETTFGREKRTTAVRVALESAWFGAKLDPVPGYEIHAGRVERLGPVPRVGRLLSRNGAPVTDAESADGATDDSGAVLGTMVHGLLEADGPRDALLAHLRGRSGIDADAGRSPAAAREAEYDRLADAVEAHVDIELLAAIAGLKQSDCGRLDDV